MLRHILVVAKGRNSSNSLRDNNMRLSGRSLFTSQLKFKANSMRSCNMVSQGTVTLPGHTSALIMIRSAPATTKSAINIWSNSEAVNSYGAHTAAVIRSNTGTQISMYHSRRSSNGNDSHCSSFSSSSISSRSSSSSRDNRPSEIGIGSRRGGEFKQRQPQHYNNSNNTNNTNSSRAVKLMNAFHDTRPCTYSELHLIVRDIENFLYAVDARVVLQLFGSIRFFPRPFGCSSFASSSLSSSSSSSTPAANATSHEQLYIYKRALTLLHSSLVHLVARGVYFTVPEIARCIEALQYVQHQKQQAQQTQQEQEQQEYYVNRSDEKSYRRNSKIRGGDRNHGYDVDDDFGVHIGREQLKGIMQQLSIMLQRQQKQQSLYSQSLIEENRLQPVASSSTMLESLCICMGSLKYFNVIKGGRGAGSGGLSRHKQEMLNSLRILFDRFVDNNSTTTSVQLNMDTFEAVVSPRLVARALFALHDVAMTTPAVKELFALLSSALLTSVSVSGKKTEKQFQFSPEQLGMMIYGIRNMAFSCHESQKLLNSILNHIEQYVVAVAEDNENVNANVNKNENDKLQITVGTESLTFLYQHMVLSEPSLSRTRNWNGSNTEKNGDEGNIAETDGQQLKLLIELLSRILQQRKGCESELLSLSSTAILAPPATATVTTMVYDASILSFGKRLLDILQRRFQSDPIVKIEAGPTLYQLQQEQREQQLQQLQLEQMNAVTNTTGSSFCVVGFDPLIQINIAGPTSSSSSARSSDKEEAEKVETGTGAGAAGQESEAVAVVHIELNAEAINSNICIPTTTTSSTSATSTTTTTTTSSNPTGPTSTCSSASFSDLEWIMNDPEYVARFNLARDSYLLHEHGVVVLRFDDNRLTRHLSAKNVSKRLRAIASNSAVCNSFSSSSSSSSSLSSPAHIAALSPLFGLWWQNTLCAQATAAVTAVPTVAAERVAALR